MERKLELKDIAGYLPYDLYMEYKGANGIHSGVCKILAADFDGVKVYGFDFWVFYRQIKPILRPSSDLYRPVMHNGKEVVPIVELAKITRPSLYCEFDKLNNTAVIEYSRDFYFCAVERDFKFKSRHYKLEYPIKNQYQLFDYLHELKIDYRGLIDAGLAIDCNTMENNPYK